MALAGEGYEILGVGLDGPGPVGRAYFELHPGVTVLYGRNGAGKTHVLAGIEAALSGEPASSDGGAECWVRVLDPEGKLPDDGWLRELAEAMAGAVGEELERAWTEDWGDDLAEVDFGWAEDTIRGRFVEASGSLASVVHRALSYHLKLGGDLSGEFEDAARSFAAMGIFWLETHGSVDSPTWSVASAIALDAAVEGGWASQAVDLTEFIAASLRGESPEAGSFPLVGDFMRAHLTGSLFRDRLRTGRGRRATERSVERPSWAAVEIGPTGALTDGPVRVIRLGAEVADVAAWSLDIVRGLTDSLIEAVVDEEVRFDQRAEDLLRSIEEVASDAFALLLVDAPQLRCVLSHPNQWLSEPPVSWVAIDRQTRRQVPLDALSSAERKWAVMSIQLALSLYVYEGPTVLVIDEPEASLHRSAERHLVEGLLELSREDREGAVSVVVASHSPAFLRSPAVRKVHVSRGLDGETVLGDLSLATDGDHDALAALALQLGLEVGELLAMVRCFLVVEGEHDRVIFETLFGDELAEAGVRLVAMRGARDLAPRLLSAQLIFDYTDAPICLVLDHLDQQEITDIWEQARATSTVKEAKNVLRHLGRIQAVEAEWLRELGERAASTGRLDRVHVRSLSRRDIVCYLPPESLELVGVTWDELDREHRRLPREQRKEFKAWLRDEHGARVSTSSISEAAAAMDSVPDELWQVAMRAMEIAGFDASAASPAKG